MAPVIEHALRVLRLPADAHPIGLPGEPYYLPTLRDQGSRWRPLVAELHWMYAGEILRHVCSSRAVDSVDGSLQVQGLARLTPERYLGRWREAIAEAVNIVELPARWGLRLVASFAFDPQAVPLARTSWSGAPVGGLPPLLDAHGARLVPVYAGIRQDVVEAWRLSIDLTRDGGARDAWWVHDFLRPGRHNPHPLQVAIDCVSAVSFDAGCWQPQFTSASEPVAPPTTPSAPPAA